MAMPLHARQAALLRPATVAIHDDGDVSGQGALRLGAKMGLAHFREGCLSQRHFWSAVASAARHRFLLRARAESGVALRLPPHSKEFGTSFTGVKVSARCCRD